MPRQKNAPRKLNETFSEAPTSRKKKRKGSSLKTSYNIEFEVQISESFYPYKLGCFIINVQESKDFESSDSFFVTFETESTNCTLSWTETDKKKGIQEKTMDAVCDTPYNILEDLYTMKNFHFICNTRKLSQGNNIIQIYLNPSTFINLRSASDPYVKRHRRKVYDVLNYFLKVEFEEYEEIYLYEGEQIENLYSCIENCYDPALSEISIAHNSLIPSLRKYQSQAVNWMLKHETSINDCKADLHELYTLLKMQDGQEVYFHKYGGYFVNCKYAPEEQRTGGILADEMGLGKTLEVLACILMNPRNKNGSKIKNEIDSEQLTIKMEVDDEQATECDKNSNPTDSDTETEKHFECTCGLQDSINSSNPVVCCRTCGALQHAQCLFYRPELLEEKDNYTCPYCWIKKSKLQLSRATLIISPMSILYQWEQEISRHIRKDHLKVFMYLGVKHQKFVDPSYLADHDIVLVSYETLKNELNYVDLLHGKTGKTLRHCKKFIAIPSPLCAVEWWRICLDEAQMVENVSTKTAKMTNKLHSVHCWCVTGTPIQKSIEDLYGLLVFLDVKPYHEKTWWKEALRKPYVNGNTLPLRSVLKQIAWRTTKQQVLEQIGLPVLEEVLHKLEFSAIERVYYDREHKSCQRDFIARVTRIGQLDVKLHCMDKHLLSKIMFPMRKLQYICCHFYISRGNNDMQKKKLTTSELLAHLLKTTKYECEDSHRKLLMAMSGMAGIYFIQNEFQKAVDLYEKILNSMEDTKIYFRTDVTQKIHSLHQLSNIFNVAENSNIKIESKFVLSEITARIEQLSTEYVEKYKLTIEVCRKDVYDDANEISIIMEKFKLKREEYPTSAWYATVFENVEESQREALMKKIEDVLKDAPGLSLSRNKASLAHNIADFSFFGLLSRLLEMSKDLHLTRVNLLEKIQTLNVEPTVSMMNSAVSCHLRGTPKKKENEAEKCIYCKADELFELYETKLYRFEKIEESERSKRSADIEKEAADICFEIKRRGNQGDSDLELVLKFLLNYSRRFKGLADCTEDGVNEVKLFDAMKKEHKHLRNLWIKIVEYVQQKDEIEMAKVSTRLLLPGETPPNPPVPYILLPQEILPKLEQHHSDIVIHKFELKKKMGHLFYLKNLEKAENKGVSLEENCPICQESFEKSWSVLQCGHSYCLICIQKLLGGSLTNNSTFVRQGLNCPICRQYTPASDVYIIDNNKDKEQEEFSRKGYSTKTCAILKCLLDIKKKDSRAKSLVFSNFSDYLLILGRALQENDVKYLSFCDRIHFQEDLEKFKTSEDFNVLLIPLSFGCSGLNITEATNVLLVEPVLDNSKHLQAIGRIHRIGQTKKTTVHRFAISRTIEENIYDAIQNSPEMNNHIHSELTLKNLVDVFNDH